MVDQGKKLVVGAVDGWYDCGKVDTLLETNRHLLEHGRARRPAAVPKGVTIVEPVYIEDGVTLRDCNVGPNVSVETGSEISGSVVADSILGRNVQIAGATVRGCLIGDGQSVGQRTVERSVLDGGVVAAAQ